MKLEALYDSMPRQSRALIDGLRRAAKYMPGPTVSITKKQMAELEHVIVQAQKNSKVPRAVEMVVAGKTLVVWEAEN